MGQHGTAQHVKAAHQSVNTASCRYAVSSVVVAASVLPQQAQLAASRCIMLLRCGDGDTPSHLGSIMCLLLIVLGMRAH
jgi:hypothetical protein